MAIGTVTVTSNEYHGKVNHVSLAWTSNAGGTASSTFSLPTGTLMQVYISPGGSVPTNGYTVAVTDVNGLSILTDGAGGTIGGGSLTGASYYRYAPRIPDVAADGKVSTGMWITGSTAYTLTVLGAGNATNGTVDLYVAPTTQ